MRSVVYIDVVFLANLWMDYILLRVTGIFIQRESSRRKCFFAAMTGSLFSCILLCIPGTRKLPLVILMHGLSTALMVRIAYGIRKGSLFFQTIIALYLMAFLAGGFWEVLRTDRTMTIKIFLIAAGVTYMGMTVIFHIWDAIQIRRKNVYPVMIYYERTGYGSYGFYDSGNLLTDSINGKPVSVMRAETAQNILTKEVTEKLRYLKDHPEELNDTALFRLQPHFQAYRTIDGNGIFPVITLDKILIQTPKEQIEIKRPVFAVVFDSSNWESEHNILLNSRLL